MSSKEPRNVESLKLWPNIFKMQFSKGLQFIVPGAAIERERKILQNNVGLYVSNLTSVQKKGAHSCWPTRPLPYRWSSFAHMVSVRTSARHKETKTRYKAETKYVITLNAAWWVTLKFSDLLQLH